MMWCHHPRLSASPGRLWGPVNDTEDCIVHLCCLSPLVPLDILGASETVEITSWHYGWDVSFMKVASCTWSDIKLMQVTLWKWCPLTKRLNADEVYVMCSSSWCEQPMSKWCVVLASNWVGQPWIQNQACTWSQWATICHPCPRRRHSPASSRSPHRYIIYVFWLCFLLHVSIAPLAPESMCEVLTALEPLTI